MLERRQANIRVDTTLVQINVTVTDPLNRFVTGLEKEHFRLFEDKVEQSIVDFSSEDAPLSIGLVFDTSGSMGPKLQKSRQAAAEFFKTANPEDEFFLIEFNDRPELVVPFTTDTEEIQNRLTFSQSKGKTALLDGVYMAMNQMKKARNPRKAVLIISDGGDNNSRYTESEIKNAVREADVQIYGIGIFEPIGARGHTPEELAGPGLLSEVAQLTGGRSYTVENPNELVDIAAKIGIELRNQYVLYYTPHEPDAGRQISSCEREAGAAARSSAVESLLPPGVLCAYSVACCWRFSFYPLNLAKPPSQVQRPDEDPVFRADTRLV